MKVKKKRLYCFISCMYANCLITRENWASVPRALYKDISDHIVLLHPDLFYVDSPSITYKIVSALDSHTDRQHATLQDVPIHGAGYICAFVYVFRVKFQSPSDWGAKWLIVQRERWGSFNHMLISVSKMSSQKKLPGI